MEVLPIRFSTVVMPTESEYMIEIKLLYRLILKLKLKGFMLALNIFYNKGLLCSRGMKLYKHTFA